jgi:isoleucyl-tRNA synthetase
MRKNNTLEQYTPETENIINWAYAFNYEEELNKINKYLETPKKENIKVRQPLQRIMIPIIDQKMMNEVKHVQDLILSEVNVKELSFIEAIDKSIKPNFRSLGKKVGAKMKQVADLVSNLSQSDINTIETAGKFSLLVDGEVIEILPTDV